MCGEGGAVYQESSLSGPSVGDCEGLRGNLVLCYKVTKVDSVWRGLKVGGGWEAEGWREEGRERRRHMTKEGQGKREVKRGERKRKGV